MVNRIFKKIIFFVTIIFFVNFISADFTVGNLSHFIEKSYGPGEIISGWANISLNNEPANSVLKSFFNNDATNSINLFDLIKKISNSNFIYNCDPLDCKSDYAGIAGTGESSKTINLQAGNYSIIGFNITNKNPIKSIDFFSIKVLSNSLESSNLPLSIDILNDGQIDWQTTVESFNFNNPNQGCYVEDSSILPAPITTEKFCEKMTLSQSPSIYLGANLIGGGVSANFIMSIVDVGNTIAEGTCTVAVNGNGAMGCVPANFPINQQGDYFVCIKAKDSTSSNKYSINSETNNPCGFVGTYSGVYNYDFNIFTQTKKYASGSSVGTITINDTNLYNQNIKDEVQNYISSKYNNNCSNGCIIPIKFTSRIDQTLSITEPLINYTAAIYALSEVKLYNIEETPAKISSGFQKLFLDEAGFSVPTDYGNKTISIMLNNNPLFSETISVEKVPLIKYLIPQKTAVGYPTRFVIVANSTGNITKYNWEFGDGNSENTTTNELVYTYSSEGNYDLKITAFDSKGKKSSKTFTVEVDPASEIVPVLLEKANSNLANIKQQIISSDFSQFEQNQINKILNINGIENNLSQIGNASLVAASEQDYQTILGNLLMINIPNSIETTASSKGVVFYPQPESINLDILQNIGRGNESTAGQEDAYKNAILAWEEANLNVTLVYHQISSVYDNYEEPLLNTFDFIITQYNESSNPYLIIKDMNNLNFNQDYSSTENSGYTYITLNQPQQEIVFSTSEDVGLINLPAFISPKISELSLEGVNIPEFQKGLNKWIFFAIIVMLIILVGIGIWVVIRMWYKRKYENYLFKNRNNLYNLINYIYAEKKKGTEEKEIKARLKKTGWNSEQVNYALKKYSGKKIV